MQVNRKFFLNQGELRIIKTAKLIDSYILSKEFLHNFESKHWKTLNEPKRSSFFDSIDANIGNLSNFRSDKELSKGLDDAVEIKYIPEVFFELAKKHKAEDILENLQDKNVGNSNYSINIFDKFMDYHELFLIDYALTLQKKILSKLDQPLVCEIGGGYGSLARMLTKKVDCKYILIDLPEANLLSAYYLNEHFSGANKKFLLFSDLKKNILDMKDIENYDFIIIPPNVQFSSDIKIDLFINTRSMMEMTKAVIQDYFDIIQKNVSDQGYFLNVNRYIKKTVGEKIMISRYPYDENWKVKISKKAFLQDHIHFLLTKRDHSQSKNIFIELKKIEAEAKKYFEARPKLILRYFISLIKMVTPKPIKVYLKGLLFTSRPE